MLSSRILLVISREGEWSVDGQRKKQKQRRTISAAKSVKDRSCIGEQKMWRALIGQVDKLLLV